MDVLGLDKKIEEMRVLVSQGVSEGGELFEMSLNISDLEHKIMSSIRFAMFSKKGLKEEISPFTSILKGGAKTDSALLQLNVAEVVQINELFDGHTPLQQSIDLKSLGNQSVKVYFDYERSQSSVVESKCDDMQMDIQEVLKRWDFLPMLAPISSYLDWDAVDLTDSYMWAISDAYEEWKWAIERKIIGTRFIQIGGWPYWIQSGEDDKFVARIDNGWGDSGSVYLCYDEIKHKFSTIEQTC